MRTITLFLFAALAVTSVDAASYQKTNGTIVDPIQFWYGGNHSYSGNNLEPHANLSGANLNNAALYQADLSNASLDGANLWGTVLYEAILTGATLTDADLQYINLDGADLSFANLTSANLSEAGLNKAILTGADLEGAVLYKANLGVADLEGADLTNADLDWANLIGADLTDADLSGSDFTDVKHYTLATWTDAFYYTDNEPTWRSGMDAAWRTSAGILALAPTSAVPEPAALLLALFGLALLPRRRRR